MACQLHWLTLLQLLVSMWLLTLYSSVAGEVFTSEPADLAVVVGGPASFQCRVNPAYFQQSISANPNNNMAVWYRIREGGGGADRIVDSMEGRFFIVGSQMDGVFDLYINNTMSSDSGTSYLCLFNQTTSRTAILNLLPVSWRPTCLSYPSAEVQVGADIEIVCTSDGDEETTLLWQRNGFLVEGAERTVTGKAVTLSYTKKVASSDKNFIFMCSATIEGMVESGICSVGPIEIIGTSSNSQAYIPYVIVGLLSVVVSMLFLTLIVVVFRHRQCRMCQRPLPEPQTVLDMSQIRPGGPPPFYVIDGDDISLDKEEGVGSSPPPDVIPTAAPVPVVSVSSKKKPKTRNENRSSKPQRERPRQQNKPSVARSQTTRSRAPPNRNVGGGKLRRTSSNTTLQGNIDDRSKDKTVTGKKKLTMTSFVKASNKRNPTRQSHSSGQARPSHSKQRASSKDRKQADEDVKSQKQLNIDGATLSSSPPASIASPGNSNTATDAALSTNDISLDFVETSPNEQKAPNMNDLGDLGGNSALTSDVGRESQYRKNVGQSSRPVSQDFNNVEELKHLQIAPDNSQQQGATSSNVGSGSATSTKSTSKKAANSDKIIYAELDFRKPVGLNIMPEV